MTKSIAEIDDYFNAQMPNFALGNLRDNRLDRMELLLSRLNHPEDSFTSYHIAGSKGKGTTATYLSKIIDDNLGRCGLYMSPHVYDVRERFTNASRFFSDDIYMQTFDLMLRMLEGFSIPEELGAPSPTTFELYTAYGYMLFKESGCKYAVIETGLGGRLDATNTLKDPKAVIFTEIEMEHTNVLGNTFEEIANEKLGIYRNNAKVFYYQDKLKPELDKRGIEANKISLDFSQIQGCNDIYRLKTNDGCNILLSNASKASVMDSIFAYKIAKALSIITCHDDIDLSTVSLPARFEKKKLKEKNILTILEGAHTKVSCISALDSLKKLLGDSYASKETNDVTLIFSLADGKDSKSIIKEIFPSFDKVFITSLGKFKKSSPEKLQEEAIELFPNKSITLEMDASKAIDEAISITNENGIIFVLGSFYLADEINTALKDNGYVN